MSREETIAYGERFGIPAPVKKIFSHSDRNLLGRSIEAGPRPEHGTAGRNLFNDKSDRRHPDEPEYVEIGFEKGIPTTLNRSACSSPASSSSTSWLEPMDLVESTWLKTA